MSARAAVVLLVAFGCSSESDSTAQREAQPAPAPRPEASAGGEKETPAPSKPSKPAPAAQLALPDGAATRLGDTGLWHSGPVHGVAISPDGKRIASAAQTRSDHALTIWNASTGERHQTRAIGYRDAVHDIAFSPDGERVAVAGAALEIHNRAGDVVSTSQDKTFPVKLRFTADGARIVAICEDRGGRRTEVRVVDAHSGKLIKKWAERKLPARGFDVSRDGTQVALAGVKGPVRIHDLGSGKLVKELAAKTSAVAYAPDGGLVAVDWNGGLMILHPDSGAVTRRLGDEDRPQAKESPRGSVAQSRNGRFATVVSYVRPGKEQWEARLRTWDLESGAAIVDHAHFGDIEDADLSVGEDGTTVAGLGDHQVRVWGPSGAPTFANQGPVGELAAVAYTADGKHIVTAGDRSIHVWDAAGGGMVRRIATTDRKHWPLALGFSADGARLMTSAEWLAPRIVEFATGDNRSFEVEGARCAAFTADGAVAIGALPRPGVWELGVYDLATAKPRQRTTLPRVPDQLHRLPDGHLLLAGSVEEDSGLGLWDPVAKKFTHTFAGGNGDGEYRPIAVRADGAQLAVMDFGEIQLYDIASGKRVGKPLRAGVGVLGIALSPDGAQIAIGTKKHLQVRALANGATLATHAVPAHAVTAVAFSPDGKALVSVGRDGLGYVWPVPTP